MADRRLGDPSQLMDLLRRERLKQDAKFEWLGARVGVAYQTLQKHEAGTATPTEPTLRKWLKALELPEEWADEWLDWQVEEQVAEILGKLRGPRALPGGDIDAIRSNVRAHLRARR